MGESSDDEDNLNQSFNILNGSIPNIGEKCSSHEPTLTMRFY